MPSEIKNLEVKEVKAVQSAPKSLADKSKKDKPKTPDPKHDKPKARLHQLAPYTGTLGEYGANPDGLYNHFTLTTAAAATHTVKFPPHFGQALHAAAQPGAAVTVLGFVHTTPKGDEHLHLTSLEVAGQHLQPQPAGSAELVAVQGEVAALLRDPKGHPRALRLTGEASELRFPPHLGEQLAKYLLPGAAVQASATRRADQPGERRAPGTAAPLQLTLLTIGGESFLIR